MEAIGFGNEELLTGCTLRNARGLWTVICTDPIDTYVVRRDSSRLVREVLDTMKLHDDIRSRTVEILEVEKRVIPKMSPDAEKRLERDWEVVMRVKALYGPTYGGLFTHKKKPELQEIFRTCGVPVTIGWKIVGRFLRNGMTKAALLDPRYLSTDRKTIRTRVNGRRPLDPEAPERRPLSEYDYAAFEFGLKILLGSTRQGYASAYRTMMGARYCEIVDGKLKIRDAPSQRRFEYYCKNRMTEEQRLRAKRTEREFVNDCRYIFDTNITNTLRVGSDIEIDAFEPEIQLVSGQDSTRLVGKATVYTAMDIRTRMILAVSVGFEENSYIGISNLMRNLLVDDNYDRMLRFGFEDVDRNLVPQNIHPETAYLDRGPEMKADDTISMFRKLGITLSSEPPATGSMKGMIERSYRTFMETIRPELENYGLTTGKHGDNGRKTAALTVDGFEKLMMRYVIYHNSTPNSKYILTPEMIARKPKTVSPVWLWEFGISRKGMGPDFVPSAEKRRILFDLMKEIDATFTREGIVFEHLVYDAREDGRLRDLCMASKKNANKQYPDGRRLNKVRCLRDPRDIGKIYVQMGPDYITVHINVNRCGFNGGMSWAVYENRFLPQIKKLIRKGKAERDIAAIMFKAYTAYLAETNRRFTYADVKNETENLAKEKAYLNYRDNLGNTLRELDGEDPMPADVITIDMTEQDGEFIPDEPDDDTSDTGDVPSDRSKKSRFFDLY